MSVESHFLEYSGDPALREAAIQIAKILTRTHKENKVGSVGPNGTEMGDIKILINDKGAVDILDGNGGLYTTGMGMVLGTLMGVGLVKKKNFTVDQSGVYSNSTYPCSAVRFDSFSDLAECANALAKSKDEKIDIASLPKSR